MQAETLTANNALKDKRARLACVIAYLSCFVFPMAFSYGGPFLTMLAACIVWAIFIDNDFVVKHMKSLINALITWFVILLIILLVGVLFSTRFIALSYEVNALSHTFWMVGGLLFPILLIAMICLIIVATISAHKGRFYKIPLQLPILKI